FSSRRRHTRSYGDWSSDVCSSDLVGRPVPTSPRILSQVSACPDPVRPPSQVSLAAAISILGGQAGTRTSCPTGIRSGVRPSCARSEERRVGKEGRWGGSPEE